MKTNFINYAGLWVVLSLHSLPAMALMDAGVSVNDTGVGATVSDDLYYKIGGAEVATRSSSRMNTIGFGIGAEWEGFQMCSKLDLEATVANQLNGLSNGFKSMMSEIMQGATAAIGSLPALIIKRANPDLYDLLNNGVLQARVDFDKGQLNCQRFTEIMEGAMSGTGWDRMAALKAWQEKIGEMRGDAVAVQEEVAKESGNKGVPWVGGETRGGRGQAPVSITKDTVIAGYNILNGRHQADDLSPVPSSSCTGELCRHWPTPEDAAAFMTRVVGEQLVRTCEGCEKSKTTAGVGLMPLIAEEQEKIQVALEDLVTKRAPINDENLDKASGGSMRTNRTLIEALQRDPDQNVLIQRLSGEMALVRVLELAVSVSRAMLAGMKEPNIANVSEAMATNDRSLSMLEREINMIKLELDLRNSIANNTAVTILERRAGRREAGKPIDQYDPVINRPAQTDESRGQ
ncbi:integrating conjugative element protein [Pseudomonas sp. GOM7]|uniref:integrating conjugative element protein n=1 Tax=Pseudomonas sp. GOM7 TaxID=2998079 RepID=UPI00227A20BC|nr:integrating conjugative element protein [Pseudomonas sp. GOM7]WAJ37276.1 integrating conjugative element protein [Pseudomonas sp. GOM7]